ncbi:MAG TPA: ubiquinol-cytochrome c reductase iron-sulfur subunit [Thermomicrobiales bacterium]|nr:ubiquinol-cytochrome c reductase iron-sulfur subunit [Thermomicrobiales bacterium]
MVEPSPDTRPSQTDLRTSQERYLAYRQAHQEERLATRRRILRWAIRVGTGAFSLALLLPALALRSLTREVQEVTAGDLLVYATGDQAGLPVDVAAIEPDMAVQAFPEGKSDNERNLIELVRLAADLPAGLVAYSAICTHLGCTVLPSLSEQGYIVCPCHASLFDPAAAARVITGPANRPLPSLPIEVSSDGVVRAAGGFEGPVGPA